MRVKFLPIWLLAVALLAGCSNSGAFLAANQTLVTLDEGNYTLSATNLSGEAEAAYLFGISYSTGLTTGTFSIARVTGTGKLYAEALEDLWRSYEATHGRARDRSVALVNVRYDSDLLNLLLYTRVRITVRADLVEFEPAR